LLNRARVHIQQHDIVRQIVCDQQAVALPFAIPDWVPDEATKRRALRRAYELVRGITDAWGAVDVSKEGSVIRLQQPE
jgi:hypothetical protein